jgi:hypothetical protein
MPSPNPPSRTSPKFAGRWSREPRQPQGRRAARGGGTNPRQSRSKSTRTSWSNGSSYPQVLAFTPQKECGKPSARKKPLPGAKTINPCHAPRAPGPPRRSSWKRQYSRFLISVRLPPGPCSNEHTVRVRHGGDYSELEFDSPRASRCSRFSCSSSFARVSCRNSSASVASEVVNGPLGGRCPSARRRLKKLRKGFIGKTLPWRPVRVADPGAASTAAKKFSARITPTPAEYRRPAESAYWLRRQSHHGTSRWSGGG